MQATERATLGHRGDGRTHDEVEDCRFVVETAVAHYLEVTHHIPHYAHHHHHYSHQHTTAAPINRVRTLSWSGHMFHHGEFCDSSDSTKRQLRRISRGDMYLPPSRSLSSCSTPPTSSSDTTSLINPAELRQPATGMAWYTAVLIVTNCTVGMGILNFPRAYATAGGIGPALALQTLVVLLMSLTLSVVVYVARYYGDVTFQGLIGSHLGSSMKSISRVCILCSNFGILVVFLVVIGDQMEKVSRALWPQFTSEDSIFLMREVQVPIIAFVFIFPFCLFKKFEIFKYTSFLGIFAAVYLTFGLIMARYFTNHQPASFSHRTPSTDVLKLIPVLSFSFEFHIEMPPLIACLRRKDFWYIERTIVGYVLLSFVLYSVAGVFGYLTFGDATPDDILLAYEPDDILLIVALALLSLKIVTTYPVAFYCLRTVVDDFLRDRSCHRIVTGFIVPFLLFLTSVLIAVFVPNITVVIGIIGGLNAMFIFVFPGLCLLKMYVNGLRFKQWIMIIASCFFVTFGFFLFGLSTANSIYYLIDKKLN